MSHAVAFRRGLKRAFGIEQWNAAEHRFVEVTDRPLTPRELKLFEDTAFTRPVDFHS